MYINITFILINHYTTDFLDVYVETQRDFAEKSTNFQSLFAQSWLVLM